MEEVYIPRIQIKRQDGQFIKWNRRQFPVTPAITMTFHKSQSKTLIVVVVRLVEPTFTHGQLYVAASRVGDPQHHNFAVNRRVRRKTGNVFYKEIL